MDENGFIFTTDAILALVVVIVLTASITTYLVLPVYTGESHQHLEALADSALNVMEQDGTLRAAAVSFSNGNSSDAISRLNTSLSILIPDGIGYKITVGSNPSVSDNRGLLTSNDVVTKVKTISGPREGWMGRSYYNIKEVDFVDQQINTTTTVWNFHNWLTNFEPWHSTGLDDSKYWGCNYHYEYDWWGRYYLVSDNTPIPINFSLPSGSTINGLNVLIGSSSTSSYGSSYSSYGANFVLNGNTNSIPSNSFSSLYTLSSKRIYNYKGSINSNQAHSGINNFYLNFVNPTSRNDMPWFSLIANYTTTIKVPQGVSTNTYAFSDCAGLAYPSGNRINTISYNLGTGGVTTSNRGKQVSWDALVKNPSDQYADGVPFVINDMYHAGGYNKATAVSTVQTIDTTNLGSIKDAYVVLNSYGAVDGAMVEVWNGNSWNVAFCSFDEDGKEFTRLSDGSGYGNVPGIIDIHQYMMAGQQNKVRITVWDNAPGNDYDLVGLTKCYTTLTTTKLPVGWDTYNYTSMQSGDNQNTIEQTQTFKIRSNDTKEVLLFVGTGADSQKIRVEYDTGQVLYEGSIPYVLDLGKLDAENAHVITTGNSGNYTFIPGDYNLKVTVTAGSSWASGDGASSPPANANAELFSGTRIAVISPALLRSIWSESYASTPEEAKKASHAALISQLQSMGFKDIDENLIVDEAMYTGDVPNSIPVRLDLWQG
jgi:hypothetical protein